MHLLLHPAYSVGSAFNGILYTLYIIDMDSTPIINNILLPDSKFLVWFFFWGGRGSERHASRHARHERHVWGCSVACHRATPVNTSVGEDLHPVCQPYIDIRTRVHMYVQ